MDGLPLAIELAAARLRMLSVEQIATGLRHRFRLLSGGPRTATRRQQALHASVQWSHDLLTREERVLLRRFSVFSGGFTYEAAEQVCAFGAVAPERLLDLLGSLVDQSLVLAAEQGSAMRYRLLETMREFAGERLAEAGEQASLRARHRDAFLDLAERAGPQLETGRQREWLALLDPEAANLVAAIEHALRSDAQRALRFCAALYRWWGARGRFAEAELFHSRILEACGDREPGLRARVLHGRAFLAVWAGEFAAADAHATEALGLAEQAGDDTTAARARCQLGAALQFADPRASRAELGRAAALARGARDDWALATAQWLTVGTYMWQSDHARAAHANQQLAELAIRQGDPLQIARYWLYVTWMACLDGRFSEARQAIQRLRAVVEGIGEPVMEALADHFVAFADTSQGEPARALEHQPASLERALTLGVGSVVPWLIFDRAFAELALGRPERARDALLEMLGLVEGRMAYGTAWALCLLAETERLLGDGSAEATASQAQTTAERLGNRLFATVARLTQGRLAAARGDWRLAQHHALAHLDACAEGGHTTYLPACLDALAEIATGLHRYVDAVRLLAAAERVRATDRHHPRPPGRPALGCDRPPVARRAARQHLRGGTRRGRPTEHASRARVGAPRPRPTRAPARRLGIADPNRGESPGTRHRRPQQPPDRRAHVHLSRDRQDPPRPHLQEDRRAQPRRTGQTFPTARPRLASHPDVFARVTSASGGSGSCAEPFGIAPRRQPELPSIFAAELRRAVVADAVADRGNVVRPGEQQQAGLL